MLYCLNNFGQSAVSAGREGDKNTNSGVVAGTMQLLANSSYGYQIMDRSRHTVTRYLSDENTHGAIKNKIFRCHGYINDQLYEVKLVKSENGHKELIFIGFSVLQYAKLRMLVELSYNFFDNYCDVTKFEELEMKTHSLHPTNNEKRLEFYATWRLDR